MITRSDWKEVLILLWGAGGVIVFLLYAVVRLIPIAAEALSLASTPLHWAAFGGSIAFLGYFEGYRAFQRAFSPRVVARAQAVAEDRRPLLVALAPVVCMGLMHATPRRLISSWAVVIGVTLLVIGVGLLDQPWRGAVDAGVVVGLSWGSAAILAYGLKALKGGAMPVSADVPR